MGPAALEAVPFPPSGAAAGLVGGAVETLAENLAIGLVGGPDLPKPFLPTGIAVDINNNIYISADIDNAIYKLSKKSNN